MSCLYFIINFQDYKCIILLLLVLQIMRIMGWFGFYFSSLNC